MIRDRIKAVQAMQDDTVKALTGVTREADRQHDAAKDEEARKAMFSTSEFCRSLIEQQTGEPVKDKVFDGARTLKGKFAAKGSFSYLFRKMQ